MTPRIDAWLTEAHWRRAISGKLAPSAPVWTLRLLDGARCVAWGAGASLDEATVDLESDLIATLAKESEGT